QGDLNQLEQAEQSYKEALTLYREDAVTHPSVRLLEQQRCSTNLGGLYLREHSVLGWPNRTQARESFRQARACAELFRGCFTDPQQRRRVLSEALPIYERRIE